MRYISTRGRTPPLSFSEAVATGLAPDGGLLVPESLPAIGNRLETWAGLDYPSLCFEFFRLFATDVPEVELRSMIDQAYADFDRPEVAPLHRLDKARHVLELFHGPTLAFKDFALQLLGRLYGRQRSLSGRPIHVLGATSGDTGAAAIHGLLHLDGVRQFVLYPRGRVSALQERQMACTGSADVFPLAIEGSFDDCQRIVKEIFGQTEFKNGHGLSAVNSINLARVLAQCVYYLYAWLRLDAVERESVRFVVPTGNFGNVLAGWLCHLMGVPGLRFQVATNRNDILYRFFSTGIYQVDRVEPSFAPSMDIQIASNFERYLHYLAEGDASRVREAMTQLARDGRLDWAREDCGRFQATRTSDEAILERIREVYRTTGYLVDPHTACGFTPAQSGAGKTEVFLATASPAKFPDVMKQAIGSVPTHPALEALKDKPVVVHGLPASTQAVRAFIEAHLPA
ncbi:MAG: threonine synthase [Opitutaceae bacterium]